MDRPAALLDPPGAADRAEPIAASAPGPTELLPAAATAAAFVVLFWTPMRTLVADWWSDPNAQHGLLLAPLAVYLAWKAGWAEDARPRPLLGLGLLASAAVLRWISAVAAEYFTMRFSMLLGTVALVVLYRGGRQVLRWWLPLGLLLLSIPLPNMVLNTLALPLQFKASQLGAGMLELRHIPVHLSGNIIQLPGRTLFVTEACSGLRSLTALLALGLLIGGLWLRSPLTRALLVALAIPVAVLLNGIRVFLTGFLVFFVNPELGEGLLHMTEGWAIFVVAFVILGAVAWMLAGLEALRSRRAA